MTWDDVRACARRGVTFGPHTVSHPILAQLDDQQSAFEMLESWRRVCAETDATVPVFCYPNGGPDDFTDRECRVLQREGFAAGVTAVQQYVDGHAIAPPLGRFRLPRFPYYQHREDFLQVISGLERAMRPLRRLYRRPGQVAADHRAEA
jgi:hypothetical protein